MNTVTLVGSTWDVDVRYTNSGMAIAKFNVSEYDGKDKETQKAKYFNTEVVCFKELAEEAGNSLERGDSVVVVGRRSQESWDDKDTGKKRYKHIVIAETIAKNIHQFKKQQPKQDSGADQFGKEVFPEEAIPF